MKPKRRVLIVEDNADLRRLYAIGLNQRGFEVKLAANGAEAIDRIETDRPDVIILDLVMPIMDGWEVIDRINQGPAAPSSGIPVLVVSGFSAPPERPVPPCVMGWLPKPASLDEVVRKLSEIDTLRSAS
jgi:CheY-like chemotaxis protein